MKTYLHVHEIGSDNINRFHNLELTETEIIADIAKDAKSCKVSVVECTDDEYKIIFG